MSDPLTELDRYMRRGEAIRRSANVKSTSDDWMNHPPAGWVAPGHLPPTADGSHTCRAFPQFWCDACSQNTQSSSQSLRDIDTSVDNAQKRGSE